VASVLATTAAKLLKLKPVWRSLLVLGRNVVAALAVSTLENNIIARHKSSLISQLPLVPWSSALVLSVSGLGLLLTKV
jgi:hypothetical protein